MRSSLIRTSVKHLQKGSIPTSRIDAHTSKIYGIDWSHENSTEILSCSLDRTIKLWDVENKDEPKVTFNTAYPIWRARDLPFGRGVLSLPQRGESVLNMWSYDHPEEPVSVIGGHSDTVKEFVWRRGGTGETISFD
jgi:WD40 repeat protein